jgi:hypothetical protein
MKNMCKNMLQILTMILVICLAGCYNKPVRHLAADVALLKNGESTQEDVLVYLGDPDEQVELEGGVEKWLYKKIDTTFFERMPLIGKRVGSPEYIQVVVTMADGIVVDTEYSATDEDDRDWASDFSWQKK